MIIGSMLVDFLENPCLFSNCSLSKNEIRFLLFFSFFSLFLFCFLPLFYCIPQPVQGRVIAWLIRLSGLCGMRQRDIWGLLAGEWGVSNHGVIQLQV